MKKIICLSLLLLCATLRWKGKKPIILSLKRELSEITGNGTIRLISNGNRIPVYINHIQIEAAP